jgi:RNA polymerase sigma-70 factor (ECF subfamily)
VKLLAPFRIEGAEEHLLEADSQRWTKPPPPFVSATFSFVPEEIVRPDGAAPARSDALLEGLRNGDEQAFELLVHMNTPRLLATARRFMRNEEDARDAVQGGFIRAFQSLSSFRGDANLSTWLHRIVVNECLMRIRSRHPEREIDIDSLLPTFLEDGHQTTPSTDWSESAETALQRAETCTMVQSCIDQLPAAYRTVLLLRDIEELDPVDVARMLNTTTNVVKVRLHRARQALRALIERKLGGAA